MTHLGVLPLCTFPPTYTHPRGCRQPSSIIPTASSSFIVIGVFIPPPLHRRAAPDNRPPEEGRNSALSDFPFRVASLFFSLPSHPTTVYLRGANSPRGGVSLRIAVDRGWIYMETNAACPCTNKLMRTNGCVKIYICRKSAGFTGVNFNCRRICRARYFDMMINIRVNLIRLRGDLYVCPGFYQKESFDFIKNKVHTFLFAKRGRRKNCSLPIDTSRDHSTSQ